MTARRKRPLTSHRWFPAALALWFAALFGLTSLAVPPALLERAVLAVGLDRVIAAAAPPLGETARLLVALGLSSVGEIVGLLIGRALAARHRPKAVAGESAEVARPRRKRDAHPDAPPRKPVSASEDLDISAEAGFAPAEPATAVSTPLVSEPVAHIAAAPLETLGVVQLSERLALALQARGPEASFGESPEGGARAKGLASLQRISGAR